MKKVIIALLLCSAAFAQNAPIPTQTFSFTASPITLPGYGKNIFTGADMGAVYSVSQNFSLENTNIVSTDGKFTFLAGGVGVKFPQISKFLNNRSTTQSGFRLLFGIRALAGEAMSSSNHVGVLLQGSVDYSLDSAATWTVGAKIGGARFPGYSGGWVSVVELGPTFSWGH
jgi:hypothetical protein